MTERRRERPDPEREQPADAQLMDRVQRGEVRAFEQLVRRHWDGLVAYAQHMTHDEDLAKDAVQETLTRFWQARSEWRHRGSVRGFLYRAVRNRVIDLGRQRRAWERWAARFRHDLLPRARTPADVVDEAELAAALERATQTLPGRRREVFVLAHFQDLSYQEIADVMNLAPQTVANHMSLALRDLRRALGPIFPQYAASHTTPGSKPQQDTAS